MMRKTFLAFFLLSCLWGVATTQESSTARIDQYLKDYLKQTGAPGLSVVVVKDGRVLWLKGYGVEKVATTKPMTGQTVSAIGSLTKSFTSLAMLQLAEKGLVDLDAPVITYLPWFRLADKKKSDLITCRMLMSMRSGIPSVDKWGDYATTTDDAIEKGVRDLANVQLSHEPGTAYEYSNEGYNVLGVVLSTVTRTPFREYMAQNVLAPLGMNHSSLDLERLKTLGILGGHLSLVDGFGPANRIPATEPMPAGSTFGSTAEDLGHYLTMILAGGEYQGHRLLSPKSFEQWVKPLISYPGLSIDQGGSGAPGQYALGWMLTEVEGRQILNHGGSVLVMTSMTALDRARGLGVSILFNYNSILDPFRFTGSSTLVNNLLRLAGGESLSDWGIPRVKDVNMSEPRIQLSDAKLDSLVGDYISEKGYPASVTKGAKGLELFYQQPSANTWAGLEFVTPSRGVGVGMGPTMTFSLQLNADGSVRYVDMYGRRLFPKTQRVPGGYAYLELPTRKLKFLLPEGWKPTVSDTGIEAGNVMTQVHVSWPSREITKPEDVLSATEVPLERGTVFRDGYGGHTYTQQSFRLTGGKRLTVVLSPGPRGVLVIKFTTNDDDSGAQRTVLGPMMKYLQW